MFHDVPDRREQALCNSLMKVLHRASLAECPPASVSPCHQLKTSIALCPTTGPGCSAKSQCTHPRLAPIIPDAGRHDHPIRSSLTNTHLVVLNARLFRNLHGRVARRCRRMPSALAAAYYIGCCRCDTIETDFTCISTHAGSEDQLSLLAGRHRSDTAAILHPTTIVAAPVSQPPGPQVRAGASTSKRGNSRPLSQDATSAVLR